MSGGVDLPQNTTDAWFWKDNAGGTHFSFHKPRFPAKRYISEANVHDLLRSQSATIERLEGEKAASMRREAKAIFRLSQLWNLTSRLVEAGSEPLSDHAWVCVGCESEDDDHHGEGCPLAEARAVLAEKPISDVPLSALEQSHD